ncbi:MAG: hypothetical protein HYY62_06540, partial [Deltaproteobacteria bacterium]|nr:hypothetical protein [Deltaproteobacteria bacterium]
DQNFKSFPLEIVIPVQLMHKLHSTPSYSADEILNSISQEFLVSKDTLLKLTADAAYAMKNKSLLKELIQLSSFSEQAGLVYFYGSQLEEDLFLKKYLLKRALERSPQDPNIRKAAHYFSLAVAEGVLQDYEQRLLEAQIFRVLDMEGVQATYWGAFKEVVFNTANSLSIIITDREEWLYEQWETQLEYIRSLQLEISHLKLQIEMGEDIDLNTQDLKKLTLTPFFKEILATGLYLDEVIQEEPSPFPSLEKLGFIPQTDFVSYSWKSIGIGQVNLFNLWMFTLLPKHFRDFGATKAGQWTVKTLRLQSFLNFLSRIPRPLDSVAVFLAIETADGCTIRWTYTALVAHDKLTRDTQSNTIKTIEENLKK